MSEPFVGEIRTFAGNFAPQGWMFCDGSVLAISENDVLFSLIGTTYGGDGQSTFALPDLRGRVPLHMGQGRVIGELGGSEAVTLTSQQIPAHTHPAIYSNTGSNRRTPGGSYWSTDPAGNTAAYSDQSGSPMNASAIGNAGGGQPHNNLQPYLVINYIISLFGIYPSPG